MIKRIIKLARFKIFNRSKKLVNQIKGSRQVA